MKSCIHTNMFLLWKSIFCLSWVSGRSCKWWYVPYLWICLSMYKIHGCQKVINRVRCKMYLHCHPCASFSTATLICICTIVRVRYNGYANSTPCRKIVFVGKYLAKLEWWHVSTHSWSIPSKRDLLISSMSLISGMICIFVIWQSNPTIHCDELSSSRCQSMLIQYECCQVFIWQGNPAHRCDRTWHMYIYDRIWKPGVGVALELKWQKMSHRVFGKMALSKLSKHA